MGTNFLNYEGRIKNQRAAEEAAREERKKAEANGDKEAEERWKKVEETAKLKADRLEEAKYAK